MNEEVKALADGLASINRCLTSCVESAQSEETDEREFAIEHMIDAVDLMSGSLQRLQLMASPNGLLDIGVDEDALVPDYLERHRETTVASALALIAYEKIYDDALAMADAGKISVKRVSSMSRELSDFVTRFFGKQEMET